MLNRSDPLRHRISTESTCCTWLNQELRVGYGEEDKREFLLAVGGLGYCDVAVAQG